MLDFFHSVALGIVEGFTEFLPISSTAHLILSARLLGLTATEYLKTFEIAIQLGAILAVVWLFGRALLEKESLKRVLVAFVPTGALGFIFYKIVKTYFLENLTIVVGALFLGGLAMVIIEKMLVQKDSLEEEKDEIAAMSLRQSFWVGVCQSLAMVPGVSRAAATVIGGRLLGVGKKTIVRFSFLLAIPTMAAATGWDILKSGSTFSGNEWLVLAVGFVVSFLTAVLSIKFLLSYIRRHDFTAFGIYRIAIALLFWFLVMK